MSAGNAPDAVPPTEELEAGQPSVDGRASVIDATPAHSTVAHSTQSGEGIAGSAPDAPAPASSAAENAPAASEASRTGIGTAATVIASVCLSLAASIAYFEFFPPKVERPAPPVMVVDMFQIAMAISEMAPNDIGKAEALYVQGAKTIDRLRQEGVVILEAKNVLMAPERMMLKPSDIIPGAPDVEVSTSFNAPDLFGSTTDNEASEAAKAIESLGRIAEQLADFGADESAKNEGAKGETHAP